MKLFPGFTSSSKQRAKRTRIFLHGNLMHRISSDQQVTEFSKGELQSALDGSHKPVFFLASPYVHTFVHETIHLSKNEMEKADQQLLGFRTPPSTHINITSLKLNDKQAITIHSHLTREGTELLKTVRKEKIRISWQPAILNFIRSIHQDGTGWLPGVDTFRIYLEEEMIEIQRQGDLFRFQHLNYLHNQSSLDERKQTIERIIEKSLGKQDFSVLKFTLRAPLAPEFRKYLADHRFTIPQKGRSVRSVTRTRHKTPVVIHHFLKRNTLLGLTTAIVIIWAILLQLHVEKVNRKRLALRQSISILRQHSDRLNQIAGIERDYARFIAIKQTTQSLKIQPSLFLEGLDRILTRDLWVRNIAFEGQHIGMELLDSGKTELQNS